VACLEWERVEREPHQERECPHQEKEWVQVVWAGIRMGAESSSVIYGTDMYMDARRVDKNAESMIRYR
jgi:hypothetical protein